MPATDGVMRPFMQRLRTWEPSIGSVLRRLIRPGSRFLDVGAAAGYFSILAASLTSTIHIEAVEPNPRALDLLRFNLWLNGVDATVWPLALSDKRRAMPLSVSPNNLGDVRGQPILDVEAYDLIVPAVSADELFRDKLFDVVKIDVQGWEMEVILGMQRIIAESRDISIVVEFWPASLRERGVDPFDVMEGYRRLGLEAVVVRDDSLAVLPIRDVVAMCDSAGAEGSANLLLRPI
jgi:FkbM family methyltransferase